MNLISHSMGPSPQAHFYNGNIQKIASLKKGQQICLVCRGGGAVIGLPMFKDCQFAQDYAEKIIKEMKLDMNHFLNGEKINSNYIAGFSLLVIAITRLLPQKSACFANNNEKCLKEIHTIIKRGINKKSFNKIAMELKTLGVQVPDLSELIKFSSSPS